MNTGIYMYKKIEILVKDDFIGTFKEIFAQHFGADDTLIKLNIIDSSIDMDLKERVLRAIKRKCAEGGGSAKQCDAHKYVNVIVRAREREQIILSLINDGLLKREIYYPANGSPSYIYTTPN